MPGIGEVGAAVLIAKLHDLGGIAPVAEDNGTWLGQRHTGGGRATVRCTLYMATLSATRCT